MFSVQLNAKSLNAASTYWESRCDGELRVEHYDAGLEFQTHFNGLLNITQHTPNTELEESREGRGGWREEGGRRWVEEGGRGEVNGDGKRKRGKREGGERERGRVG